MCARTNLRVHSQKTQVTYVLLVPKKNMRNLRKVVSIIENATTASASHEGPLTADAANVKAGLQKGVSNSLLFETFHLNVYVSQAPRWAPTVGCR